MRTQITKADALAKLGNFIAARKLGNNVLEITFENGFALQSYRALVAVKVLGGPWYFSERYHDYSATTCQHCTRFCGIDTKTRRAMLANGEAVGMTE